MTRDEYKALVRHLNRCWHYGGPRAMMAESYGTGMYALGELSKARTLLARMGRPS